MAEQTAKQRRPFHESIVDAIRRASYNDMRCLGRLISETKIPKGHDEILAAWNQRLHTLHWIPRWIHWFNNDLDVPSELLSQKNEVEKEAVEKVKSDRARETRREILRENVIRIG